MSLRDLVWPTPDSTFYRNVSTDACPQYWEKTALVSLQDEDEGSPILHWDTKVVKYVLDEKDRKVNGRKLFGSLSI